MEKKNNNDIEQMRSQLALLKNKLEEQQIVSEKIIRRAMEEKMSGINNRMTRLCLLATLSIFYCPWVFRQIGVSWLLCGVTTVFLVLAIIYNMYMRKGLSSEVMISSNLIEIGMKVSRMRRLYRTWLTRIGIPFLAVWTPWLIYDISSVDSNMEYLEGIACAVIVGLIAGLTIGLYIYKRNINAVDDILLQIEELKKE